MPWDKLTDRSPLERTAWLLGVCTLANVALLYATVLFAVGGGQSVGTPQQLTQKTPVVASRNEPTRDEPRAAPAEPDAWPSGIRDDTARPRAKPRTRHLTTGSIARDGDRAAPDGRAHAAEVLSRATTSPASQAWRTALAPVLPAIAAAPGIGPSDSDIAALALPPPAALRPSILAPASATHELEAVLAARLPAEPDGLLLDLNPAIAPSAPVPAASVPGIAVVTRQASVSPPTAVPAPDATGSLPKIKLPVFGMQIAERPSEAELGQEWSRLKTQHGNTLGTLTPLRRPAKGGAAGALQLVVGPFASATAAAQACGPLIARGIKCLPTAYSGEAM